MDVCRIKRPTKEDRPTAYEAPQSDPGVDPKGYSAIEVNPDLLFLDPLDQGAMVERTAKWRPTNDDVNIRGANPRITILTAGIKYYVGPDENWWQDKFKQPGTWRPWLDPKFQAKHLYVYDLRNIGNPGEGRYGGCLGRRPEIIKQFLGNRNGVMHLYRALQDIDSTPENENIVILSSAPRTGAGA